MAHYQWTNDEWVEMTGFAVKPVYWVVTVSHPDQGGKVYATRFTNHKHNSVDAASRELYGINITPNMRGYNMTSSITTARKLLRKIPDKDLEV